MKFNWEKVAEELETLAGAEFWGVSTIPNEGQRRAIVAIADRLRDGRRSILLADEVGMGKTLIAAALIKAVQSAGGRSAVLLPPGLGTQWLTELRRLDPDDRTLLPLRSFRTFADAYQSEPRNESGRTADRRLQREWPSREWADEHVLLLSHNLANIRQTEGTLPWYHGLGRSAAKVLEDVGRYTRCEADVVSRNAAEKIINRLGKRDRDMFKHDLNKSDDPMACSWTTMGRGLGQFDLVVIDEAHKARGTDTSLGRVLTQLVWKSRSVFQFGMTATPVELDPQQWTDTLERIGVGADTREDLTKTIQHYVRSVERLQKNEALTVDSVNHFRESAAAFEKALSPWVLRRDKREDEFLRTFTAKHGDHRDIRPLHVEFGRMGLEWKRAILATEALSLTSTDQPSPAERRLRLALPEGRGLSMSLVDATIEEIATGGPVATTEPPWHEPVRQIVRQGSIALYSHPAITRAVEEIEEATAQGHKVLVFGRFTLPMRALTALIDAREMVRRLCSKESPENRWPQSKLDERRAELAHALDAALADKSLNTALLDRPKVQALLQERARVFDGARRSNLQAVKAAIEQAAAADDPHAAALKQVWEVQPSDAASLLAALEDQRSPGERHQPWTLTSIVAAYRALFNEVLSAGDETDPAQLKERLALHLDDFGNREGHFARLMDGSTAAQTRSLLQSAFNREENWPQVLVTQSLVGREGLNLHRACRTVVMLHLEWNPAHVEQQIGRVDRIESLWSREAEAFALSNTGVAPRIVVRPIVVGGTYDEYHWTVLKHRWDAMRAQLNGDVLPEADIGEVDAERRILIDKARSAAPNFTPRPKAPTA